MTKSKHLRRTIENPEHGEVRPLFPNGIKCPRGCGSTLNQGDKIGMLLHRCDAWGQPNANMRRAGRSHRHSAA